MPLALDHNRWGTLRTAYNTPATEVAELLAVASRSGINDDLLGNIINEVQHQGDTSEAMYAVVPHLLEMSRIAEGNMRLGLVVDAGMICGSSQSKTAVPCPADLKPEFEVYRESGRKMALAELETVDNFEDFKGLLAALAGYSGYGRFGSIVDGFDLYEDRFHHVLLDEPFNED